MEYREADTTIGIGDRVRSFDFEYREDCYYEGVVYGIIRHRDQPHDFTCDVYAIKVERQVVCGEEKFGYPDNIYTPVNGTPTTFSRSPVTNGVVRI